MSKPNASPTVGEIAHGYTNWRYADFMDYWRRLADHVETRAPGKLIAMNHFNRLTQGWKRLR